MSRVHLLNKPGSEIIFKIKNELSIDHLNLEDNFIENWEIIERNMLNENSFIFYHDDDLIGFVVFKIVNNLATIEIFEIFPRYRNQKFGNLFFNEFEKYLNSKNVVLIQLDASPRTSSSFWLKMGLTKMPLGKRFDYFNGYEKDLSK